MSLKMTKFHKNVMLKWQFVAISEPKKVTEW